MNVASNSGNNRILVIDDNPAIHEDFRKILGPEDEDGGMRGAEASFFGDSPSAEDGLTFEIDSAFQGQEGLKLAERALAEGRPYAMAFVDVRMPPGWDGVETMKRMWGSCPDLQVVICTAYSDYSWREISKQAGSTDSLVILKKPFDNVEVLQLSHALTKKWWLTQQAKNRVAELDQMVNQRTGELQAEICQRKSIEQELRLSQERFSKAFRATPIPMAIQTMDQGRWVDVNDAFLETMEFESTEVLGRTASELDIWVEPNVWQEILVALKTNGSVRNWECEFRTKSLRVRHVFVSAELLNLGGEPNILVIAEDISELLHLERRLQEAQKMEAVGQLAAGVAHDFNNILTIIQGHVTLRLTAANLDSRLADSLRQVGDAAERGGKLTRQLLAFSSRQVVQPKVLDLDLVVNGLRGLLAHAAGEQITLEYQCAGQLPCLEADECSLEQVLMNLVVNARDAMPNGGKIVVRTQDRVIDESYVGQNPDARPGRFICLSVIDVGCGIDDSIRDHLFEPFFTTKPMGKGTGLGLATVFGIVKQHAGWIEVQSEVDRGSTFSVFLPASEKILALPTTREQAAALSQGTERVLVVEDEPVLLEFLQELLGTHHYQVIGAIDGETALKAWEEQRGRFDVLVTDVVMPNGMTGLELADRLRALNGQLPIIYTSGYNSEMAGKTVAPSENAAFLQKPYKPELLLQTLRQLLDRPLSASACAAG